MSVLGTGKRVHQGIATGGLSEVGNWLSGDGGAQKRAQAQGVFNIVNHWQGVAEKQQAQKRDEQRNKLIQDAAAQEATIKTELGKSREGINSAVDSQLGQMLQETGIAGKAARQQTGEAMADRGLNRSTFSNEKINEVNLAEQEAMGNQRLQAQQMKQKAADFEKRTLDVVSRKREAMKNAKTLEELEALDSQGYDREIATMQEQFATQMNEMNINSAQKQSYMNYFGDVGATAAKIFSGGLL